jgi:phosphoribosyl 1,2-cyclic phosphodiesterase
MTARFTVLASGSAGNASLLEAGGFGLLLDCGVGPHVLAERLAAVGRSWAVVSAVLLTHTHRDHWNRLTLAHLRRSNIPLVAHPDHFTAMATCREYDPMRRAGLLRTFTAGDPFDLGPSLVCRGVEVPHDSAPTFGFRIDGRDGLFGAAWSVGYASDVGHPTEELAAAFAGVDVLAIEYNHDVRMQRTSKRPKLLIDRVLGSHGHLSNAQAGELTRAVADTGNLRAVVQLHLSRECNTPDLARAAAAAALKDFPDTHVVTASQFVPTPPVDLTPRLARRRQPVRTTRFRTSVQPCLPGLEVG